MQNSQFFVWDGTVRCIKPWAKIHQKPSISKPKVFYLILLQNPFDPVVYWLALWAHNRKIAGTKPASPYIFILFLMRNLKYQSLMDSSLWHMLGFVIGMYGDQKIERERKKRCCWRSDSNRRSIVETCMPVKNIGWRVFHKLRQYAFFRVVSQHFDNTIASALKRWFT